MKKEVSQEYLKYMNNDGQLDKQTYELMKSKEKQLCKYCLKGDHFFNHMRVGNKQCIFKNCLCDWQGSN